MIGIFGGSGFIGRNIIDHFAAQGIPFRIFGRRPVPRYEGRTILVDFEDPASYRAHLVDLTSAILLVSASGPGTFANDFPSEIEKNVLAYARFIKAIERSTIERIVYLSSGGTVYGVPQNCLIDETHPTNPINPYGCSKLMIENLIKTAGMKSAWTYTILRPSNPIGPYQTAIKGQGLVAKIVQCCFSGEILEVWGDGETIRDYFDVRDLASSVELALQNDAAMNTIFNVSSGIPRSVNKIIDDVEKTVGLSVSVKYRQSRLGDVRRNVLSSKRLTSIGWKRKWPIKSSIGGIIETRGERVS